MTGNGNHTTHENGDSPKSRQCCTPFRFQRREKSLATPETPIPSLTKKNWVQGTWAPDGLTGDHQGGPSDPGNFASWKPLEAMAEIELEDVWRFAYKKWWLSMASWKTYLWKRQSVSPYQVGYATFNKRASTSKARHCPPLWPPPWDLEDPARKNWISPMCVCIYIY